MTRSALLVAVLATACVTPLAGVDAAVQCKATVTSPIAATEDLATNAWRSAVANEYGSPWADLGKAHNKQYHSMNFIFVTQYYLTAQPCRNVVVVRIPAHPKLFKP